MCRCESADGGSSYCHTRAPSMAHIAALVPSQGPLPGNALEGKGPQRPPGRRLDRRLEEVAKAVGGGYCRLQMPLKQALAVRGTVAGHRLGALEGGRVLPPPPFQCIPASPPVLQLVRHGERKRAKEQHSCITWTGGGGRRRGPDSTAAANRTESRG